MKIQKLIIAIIVLFSLPALSGCMLMHFIDNHHSKMMRHDSKGDSGDKHGEIRSRGHQPIHPLDVEPRKDMQGGVAVEIRFAGLMRQGEIAFVVKMNTHSADLTQYSLDQLCTLINDQGIEVKASRWETSRPSGDHVSGTLYFPVQDTSGRMLLAHGVQKLILRFKDVAGISERVFQWNLISGH